MIEGPIIDEKNIYICDECIDVTYDLIHSEDDEPVKKSKRSKSKILSPEKIKEHLDQYIIGQESAKIAISVAIYNHYKRLNNHSSVEIEKSNLLMIGSSGSGKTLTVKTVAKLFDLPYIIADATSLTEAGYVGEDVENLVTRLISAANGDTDRASRGIIFIDEIDKKSKKTDSSTLTRDVSGEGVQQSLLKMTEGTVVKIEDHYGNEIDFDTKDILFIFSGAFVGLDEIVRRRKSKTSIGIGADLKTPHQFANEIKSVNPDDLIKYGLIPEFVGRCPVVVVFEDLTTETLFKILVEPKNSLVSQFKALFKYEGINLDFDDKYLLNIANQCIEQKVGARGLRSVLEKNLQETQYHLPRLAKEGVSKIYVDETGSVKHIYKSLKKRVND